MVTMERPTSRGICRHALYGVVRSVSEGIDRSFWPLVECVIIVEVHCIPEYGVDWCHARLWTGLPHDAIYIQPHGFLKSDYCPVWLLALNEEEDIITVELSRSSHLTEDEFTTKIILFAPAMHLPPEYVYHVLDGNQDVAKMETAAMPEEPEAGSPDSEKSWEVLAGGQPCTFRSSVPPFACVPSSCISNQEDHAWPDEPHVSSLVLASSPSSPPPSPS